MKWTRFRLPALLVAAALLLASCGNTGFSGGGAGGGNNGMEGINHGDSGSGETSRQETTGGGIAGMDHSSMDQGSMGMAREMVMENGRYSDERFIDAMVPHHRGAVEMAEVALENADHEKISSLAENIVCAQEAEIEELKAIKEQEFGISEVPMEMSAQEMEAMGMTDPQVLAGRRPFDKAFIDAMITHHRSANAMASVTLRESHNARIKEIARAIVDAQEREIAQMQRWREEWYPRG